MYRNISIIGAGSWGISIANLLSENSEVSVFHYNKATIKQLQKNRLHPNLDNYSIPEKIILTHDKEVFSDLCILAIPVQYIRKTLKMFDIKSKNILILSKGIECDTLMFPSQIVRESLNVKDENVGVLSGPSHAELLLKKEPTAVVVSSENKTFSSDIQKTFSRDYFRAYINKDILGVQLGGAVKNVISIASGISAGLGYKENTVSAILTRSLKEVSALGDRIGISQKTIWGLACIGDLMATSFSKYSRNRSFGAQLAKGGNPKEIIASFNTEVEGVATSRSIFNLSKKFEVEMPICNMVYRVIYENKNPKKGIKELMRRPLKDEK